MARPIAELSLDGLMRRGFLPKELPPPFQAAGLADSLSVILPKINMIKVKSSQPCALSIPKKLISRRMLSIPNPLHQLRLCSTLVKHKVEMSSCLSPSSICVSTPVVSEKPDRELVPSMDFQQWSIEKFIRSADKKYVLRADLSRFYHTIYTHCIPWAIHGKISAKMHKSDASLLGNSLDAAVRNTQDQQTIGLPVGPDSSFLLAEIIGSQIARELEEQIPSICGLRYVDDFSLYFESKSKAEAAHLALTRIAKRYELDINDSKTEVAEGPDTGEPNWKTSLRANAISESPKHQRTTLVSFINRAFALHRQHPRESILLFAVKRLSSVVISRENSDLYEAFLRSALVNDPATIRPITRLIYDRYVSEEMRFLPEFIATLAAFVKTHASVNNTFEVAWALWIFRALRESLPAQIAEMLSDTDNAIVALLCLDLRDMGLANSLDMAKLQSLAAPTTFYSDSWLLTYEALRRGWFEGNEQRDEFFSLLNSQDVSFYTPPQDSGVDVGNLGFSFY